MARLIAIGVVLALSPALYGQEELTTFDPLSLQLRRIDDQWLLRAGEATLKDFGRQSADARRALKLIRDLRINQRGTIGSPEPVLEYWLSDGKPPLGLTRMPTVKFDFESLAVEEKNGLWYLRDARQRLLGFGKHAEHARQALAVMKKYGFNEATYLGRPIPVMLVFLAGRDQDNRPSPPPVQSKFPVLPRLGITSPFADAVTGEDRVRLNRRKVKLHREGTAWKLMHQNYCIADFGPRERDAREALHLLQRYQFAEHCPMTESVCYLLVNNQPMRRVPLGLRSIAFRPESLTIRRKNDQWYIWHETKPLFRVATLAQGAQLLKTMQHYRFDHICWVGSNREKSALRMLVRSR